MLLPYLYARGLPPPKVRLKNMLLAGIRFGGFQALMPSLGYLWGTTFEEYIVAVDHWVAFGLLGFIGCNMIRDALSTPKEEDHQKASYGCKAMFVLALATSIDALARGITFALLPDVNVGAAVAFIGIITFILSALGIKAGNFLGSKCETRAQLAGGIILILIGLKILLEHLELLPW